MLNNMITVDANNNVQLTWMFEQSRSFMSQQSTGSYLDLGEEPGLKGQRLECAGDLIKNKTIVASRSSEASTETLTYTAVTDWQLLTQPSLVHDLIAKGAGGKRGQMVDVLVTTVKQEIRDSSGKLTSIVLKPTKSESRSTGKPTGNSPSAPLSIGSKAGIGVGSALGALIIAGMVYLIYRHRKHRKIVQPENEKRAGTDEEYTYMKPELDSEPVHEIEPGLPVELASENLHEIESGLPAPGNVPTELSQLQLQELPGDYAREIGVGQAILAFELPSKDVRYPQELSGDTTVDLETNAGRGCQDM
ncbi:hypothetical protein N0V90_011696 [Kalmusia sp. IMI 367209]|nr:hypothetical protein N0V90_011696 [Kalmusia sp. IMI 367209]